MISQLPRRACQSTLSALKRRHSLGQVAAFHETTRQCEASPRRPFAPAYTEPKYKLNDDQIAKVDRIFHKILWFDMFEAAMLLGEIHRKIGFEISEKESKAISRVVEEDIARRDGTSLDQGGDQGGKEEVKEESKSVELRLTGFDASSKIKVIKEVRSIAGLGLKEAKELVESAPKSIQKDLKPEQAEELKAKLESVGAQVEIV